MVPLVASRQSGVFTAVQARVEGFSDRVVRRRIETRMWVYVAGRGLALPAERWSALQLAVAARLTTPNGVISHRTAGEMHRFPLVPEADQVCDVTFTPAGRLFRPLRSIRMHVLRLPGSEIWGVPGTLRRTSPLRTGLDLVATLPFGEALDLYAWLSSREILTHEVLCAGIEARAGWHGIAQLRRLAALTVNGAVSHAEFVMHEILATAGIAGWAANVSVSDRRGVIGVVDILFARERVVIEIDGFSAHSSKQAFRNDRRRQNRLVAAGYTVLRLTWEDLTQYPQAVVAAVLAAIQVTVMPASRG